MKIKIDEDYYIDENGNKFYSDNRTKEYNEKRIEQDNVSINSLSNDSIKDVEYYTDNEGNRYYSDHRVMDKYESNNISINSIEVDSKVGNNSIRVNSNETSNHIAESDLNNFSNMSIDNEEYSYYGYNCSCEKDEIKGSITVYSKLGCVEGVELKGAKINVYLLNGISPKLCMSKVTDAEGKVVFDNLDNGCYRVIAILDRRYFEKPSYISWNEVTIDSCCKESTIIVVNKIKGAYCKK